MLSRRGFLGTLLAAAGAVALPLDTLWAPMPAAAPILAPEAIVGLRQMTKYIAIQLSTRMDARLLTHQDATIGQTFPVLVSRWQTAPVTLTDQLSWDFVNYDSEVDATGLNPKFLDVVVDGFERSAKEKKLRSFAPLKYDWPGVIHGARVSVNGVSVRGLMAYNVRQDKDLVRFDVLMGA